MNIMTLETAGNGDGLREAVLIALADSLARISELEARVRELEAKAGIGSASEGEMSLIV